MVETTNAIVFLVRTALLVRTASMRRDSVSNFKVKTIVLADFVLTWCIF